LVSPTKLTNNPTGQHPARLLAKILFRAQKETGFTAMLNGAYFFIFYPTLCKPGVCLISIPDFSRLALPLLNAREPIAAWDGSILYALVNCGRKLGGAGQMGARIGWDRRSSNIL